MGRAQHVAAVVLAAIALTASPASAADAAPAPSEPSSIRSPGFLLDKSRHTMIQAHRARTHTYAHGINNRGLIAGGFDDPSFDSPDGRGLRPQAARTRRPPVGSPDGGLLLDRDVFRPLPDVPGALQTVHSRNNNRGQIVGLYVDDSDGTPRVRGFLMRKGRVTRIDVPGAMATAPTGIDDSGRVVGGWVGPDATVDPVTGEFFPVHGFLWDEGRFKKFDIPGAITTAPYEINNRGQIVGNYGDAAGAEHGFVLRRGVVTTIDHPDASDAPDMNGTRVVGIDDRGRLVGSYGDDAGTLRAWKWEDGEFTTIHPPGALHSEASEINNRGQVVGRYVDATPKLRSFLLDRGRLKRIDAPGRCDTAAFGLNDRGQIVIPAAGTTDGTTCPSEGR